MRVSRPRVAVVGHVEWVQFARVVHVPRAGEVVHGSELLEEPAGGGAVAAVQLARLAGASVLITALGDDELGRRSTARLQELGVEVFAAQRTGGTRRALTLVDEAGERTITTLGPRLEPMGDDEELPWDALAEMDAVYFTAGDLGALRAARAARVLVASPRAGEALGQGVALDALVLSGKDAGERRQADRVQNEAELVVSTEGERGGAYRTRAGESGRWDPAEAATEGADGAEVMEATEGRPAKGVDSYGCGDSFAAGLTYALGAGLEVPDALALAARCGAVCLTGRGPYQRQLVRRSGG